MHVRVRLVVLALFALFTPTVAAAQDAATPKPAPAAGPTMDGTATAFRAVANVEDGSIIEMQRRQGVGRPVALMIVGGAALLVGAVIGDDVGTLFMIGGAVALLYGLYKYLQ
jgi:hypothetical protein